MKTNIVVTTFFSLFIIVFACLFTLRSKLVKQDKDMETMLLLVLAQKEVIDAQYNLTAKLTEMLVEHIEHIEDIEDIEDTKSSQANFL